MFVSLIQGRENVQFGVAAFLVGAVFDDRRAEGLSYIARNTGRTEASWEEGIVTVAGRPDAEAIVSAVVELDENR